MEWFWAGLLGGLGYVLAGLLVAGGVGVLLLLIGFGNAMCNTRWRK